MPVPLRQKKYSSVVGEIIDIVDSFPITYHEEL